MTFDLQLEEEDYLKAAYLHGRRWLVRFALPYFVILTGLMIWISSRSAELKLPFQEGFIVFLIVVLCYKWFVQMPKRTRKNFQQQPEAQRKMTCTLDDEYYSVEHSSGSLKKPWSEFRKWKNSEDLILIYPTDFVYLVIPRRCLSDDEWNAVLAKMAEKMGE